MSDINRGKITAAMNSLNKKYGDNVVVRMSESDSSIKRFSTGRDDLNTIIGGGYPIGRIVEITGENQTGKTGLALNAIREMQVLGRAVGFIDAENALNEEYCEEIGVDIGELIFSQPETGEQGIEALKAMINTGEFGLIVVDSVSALQPKKVIECESGEAVMGLHAKLMAQMCVQIKHALIKNNCTVILLNQLRDSLSMYGASEKSTGGRAIPFYASVRIHIKKKGEIKEGDEAIGFRQHIKITKNKTAPAFKTLEADMINGRGVDDFQGFVDSLVLNNIIEKGGGGNYSYDGDKLARGIANLRTLFDDNPELKEVLKERLKETLL